MLATILFPSPDPIPLPAPVWFFKVLHATVLSLHFVTVQWVLGWLFIGVLWNFWGRARGNAAMVAGSNKMAGSLPIIMTYLIDFGIPPLLFTQVLYGSFLYTSSVLIGAWWISVIFLVILVYSSLYLGGARAAKSKAWWGFGLLALLIALSVAKIYSSNMTLMLRPGVWTEMFRLHPHGTSLPHSDPTLIPRWLFMISGGLTIGGLALIVTGIRQKSEVAFKGFMVMHGGWIAAAGALLQAVVGFRVLHSQPEAVQAMLDANVLYHNLLSVWIGIAVLVAALGLLALVLREKASGLLAAAAATAGFLLTVTMVVYRDGIRDLTLLIQGYDVWNLKVVANWPVVALFLGTFVIGLLLMGGLIAIVLKAKPANKEDAI